MQITEKTLYNDLAPFERYLTADGIKEIKAAAARFYKRGYDLTVDEYFGLVAGDYSLLGDLREPTVLQVYWLKYFAEDFLPSFSRDCETYKSPTDEKQREAQNGTYDMTMQEGMVVFLQSFFGLSSFAAAGGLTLGEYITARKHKYNCDLVQHNYDRISRREMKNKRK